ncbi:MAG: lipopolysaccharide biosynthesis protein [Actinomycetota bacterium]
MTKIAVYALGLGTSLLITRAVGAAGRGQYYLPVTLVTIAYYLGNMGTQQAQFRRWAERQGHADHFVTAGVVFAIGLGGLAALVSWALFSLFGSELLPGVSARYVVIVLPLIPILVHSLSVSGLLTLAGRFPHTNNAVLLGAIAQLVGTAALFFTGRLTVQGVLLLYGVGVVLPWLLMLRTVRAVGRFVWPIPWRFVLDQLKVGAQIEPYVIFMYLNLRIDVFFVARYMDLVAVGIYSIAVIFGELIWVVTDSLAGSVYERQFNAVPDEAVDVTLRAARMNLLLAVIVGLVIGLVAQPAIPFLFGDELTPARTVVWALLPAAAAMGVWRPLGVALLRFGAPWLQPFVASVALVVNLGANVVLIPRLGIVGAALASLLSYGVGALLAAAWLVVNRSVSIRQLLPGRAEVEQLIGFVTDQRARREFLQLFAR